MYSNKNAPPPFLAAATGKPTKLPMPTAEPAAASTKPILDENWSGLFCMAARFPQHNKDKKLGMFAELYDRHVLPTLLDFACGMKAINRQRQKVVPKATGLVLEIGIGTGLNMRHYDASKVEKIMEKFI